MNKEERKAIEDMNRFANGIDMSCVTARQIQIILNLIERLQKENEELNLKYYMLYTGKIENLKAQEVKIKSQVIPVQKVKDKIEELQKGPLKINENNKYYYETEAYNKIIIQVLQELLEGRK